MSPELTAKRISEYLTLGSHHNTPEGQEAIANIVLDATKNLSDNLHLATETERLAIKRLDIAVNGLKSINKVNYGKGVEPFSLQAIQNIVIGALKDINK